MARAYIEPRGEKTWRIRISDKFDGSGKRVQYSRTFHGTKREAERERTRLLAELDNGKIRNSPKMKLREWAEMWYEEKMKDLSPTTIRSYRQYLDNRIIPGLGHLMLSELQRRHIVEWLENIGQSGIRIALRKSDDLNKPLSPNTVRRHYIVLSSMLQDAVEKELIPFNPMRSIKPPKKVKTAMRCYDESEIRKLVAAVNDDSPMIRTLVLVALGCALRRGEIVGLRWEDVQWNKNLLLIRRSACSVKGGQQLKSPKSEKGVRDILMPSFVVESLKEWKEAQGDQNAGGFVFTLAGRWLRADEATKQFSKFLKRHGLPKIHLHGMRHTSATIMSNNGIPIKTLSDMLGHSQASTTLDYYCHSLDSSKRKAADILDRMAYPGTSEQGV